MNSKHDDGSSEMHCQSVQESVLARLDNDVDEVQWSKIEKHLLSCEACAGFAENTNLLNARLREELNHDVDVAPLWSRISLAVDAETDAEPANQTAGNTGGRMLTYGAIAAALLFVVFTFYPRLNSPTDNPPLSVTQSINDFLTFKASGGALDVESSEPVELRRWFVKRLDFEVPLNSAMPAGFKLAGARLCFFLNRRLASFVYHMGEKAASLYVMTETGLDATLKRTPKSNELVVFSSRGLSNVVWRNDGLVYVVVADFPETEAVRFAKSVGKPSSRLPVKVTFLKGENLKFVSEISTRVHKSNQLLMAEVNSNKQSQDN